MKIRFEEVKISATRRWTENGKRRQETRVFMQTINPFNKNADGLPKTREQIFQELKTERDAWLAQPEQAVATQPISAEVIQQKT